MTSSGLTQASRLGGMPALRAKSSNELNVMSNITGRRNYTWPCKRTRCMMQMIKTMTKQSSEAILARNQAYEPCLCFFMCLMGWGVGVI